MNKDRMRKSSLCCFSLWTHQVSLLLVSPLSSFGVDFQSGKLRGALLQNNNKSSTSMLDTQKINCKPSNPAFTYLAVLLTNNLKT